MEIYQPSIRGEWTYMKGRRVFKFTDGCFLGLQVLGDDVEPCFEGAGFFALYDNIVAAFRKIEELNNEKNTNMRIWRKYQKKQANPLMNLKKLKNKVF